MKKKNKIHISDEHHSRDLESLGNIFIPIMGSTLTAEDFVEADIMLHWLDIVGEEMASFCNPLKARFNPNENTRTLYMEVPAGGFALEVRHKEDYILEKINAYFGYKAIHKLNISQNMNMTVRCINIKKEAKPQRALNESERKYLLEVTEGINDEKLREILTKLGKSVILSNKGDEKSADSQTNK